MFVEFADTWQSYVATFTKTAIKAMLLKRTTTQITFCKLSHGFVCRIS